MVKYESLIEDCYGNIQILLKSITNKPVDEERLNKIINKYSFENQTRRKPGQEDVKSFIRTGQPGDWKERFTRRSAKTFNNYYSHEMMKLAYVKNDSWIDSLKE